MDEAVANLLRPAVYDKAKEYSRVLSKYKHVQYAAFFDLIENSMLDIIMVSGKPGEELKIKTIFNNIDRTAFFIKSRMLSDNKIGTTVQGSSIRCVLTDIDGHKFIVTGDAPA